MSDVRWVDQAVQKAEEKRQTDKSEEEKRQSKAAFEQRLNADRGMKEAVHKHAQAEAQTRAGAQEKAGEATREQTASEQAAAQKEAQGKKGAKPAPKKKESAVLAHVRGQAAKQSHGPLHQQPHPGLQDMKSAAMQRDLERVAGQSQESSQTLKGKGDESLTTGKSQEKSRTKETDEKDKVKETDDKAARVEAKQEAQSAQQAQAAAQAGQAERVDADGRRQQQQGREGQSGGGGAKQQGPAASVSEADALHRPSAASIARAEKAEMIQKLCEKLLDNYYLGAAPDGSAMMRMELKEGVLAGLTIDVKVDDKRRVKLTLSGDKDAVDLVTASRGELARALGRKGLVLENVEGR